MGPPVQATRRGYALAVLGVFVLLALVAYVVLVPSPSWWVETVLLVALCIASPSWGWLALQLAPPLEDDEDDWAYSPPEEKNL